MKSERNFQEEKIQNVQKMLESSNSVGNFKLERLEGSQGKLQGLAHIRVRDAYLSLFFLARSSATTTTATTVGGRNGRSCWRAASLFIAGPFFFLFQIKRSAQRSSSWKCSTKVNSNKMLKDEPQSIGQSKWCRWFPTEMARRCQFIRRVS